jgi:hypothetical protein
MLISRVHAAAAQSAATVQPRVIQVHQNFFPDPNGVIKNGPHLTVLPGPWAAEPKSVTVDGKTYAVAHVASRGRGVPMDQYRVFMDTLPSGNNPAVVKLANGVSVPVIFDVESAY